MNSSTSSAAVRESLRLAMRRLQHSRTSLSTGESEVSVISTGIAALDALLPARGLSRGTLTEWIGSGEGSGVSTLAILCARQAQQAGPVLLMDWPRCWYPPALELSGMRLADLLIVRPTSRADALWALEQSLRCRGLGAVLGRIGRLSTREARRLQLAAETGEAVGLLIRPESVGKSTCWATVRLRVRPRPSLSSTFQRVLCVDVLYARGSLQEQSLEIEVCDETLAVRVAAGLPAATRDSRFRA